MVQHSWSITIYFWTKQPWHSVVSTLTVARLCSGMNIQKNLHEFCDFFFDEVKRFQVTATSHRFLICCRAQKKKKPSQSEVIEMHFDLLHLNGTPHIHCYHSLPGGSRPPLRAKKKPLPSLMQRLFLTQVSAWMDLKGAGCSACSPSPQCKNSESCIIWQVIIIKAIKGRAQPKSKTLYFLSYL